MSEYTALPWKVINKSIRAFPYELVALTCIPREYNAERLEGESWIEMRERTEPERIAIEKEEEANAAFIIIAVNNHDKLVDELQDMVLANDGIFEFSEGEITTRDSLAKAAQILLDKLK